MDYYKKYKLNTIPNDNNHFYFQGIDNNLCYEEIKNLRKVATDNLYLYAKQKEIEDKINNENNKWFFSPNLESINKLNDELIIVKNKLKVNGKYKILSK